MTFNLQPSLSSYPYGDDPTKTIVRLEVFNRGENGFVPLTRIFIEEFLWKRDTRFIEKTEIQEYMIKMLAILISMCDPELGLSETIRWRDLLEEIEPIPQMA